MSEPQIPHECTRTTTWSGLGRGTARSSTVTTPGDWYTAADITSGSTEVEPDMGVRLRRRPQPGEPSGQVTQVDRQLPGQREVAERGVEAAGRPVLDAPSQRKPAVGHPPAGRGQIHLVVGQAEQDPGVGPEVAEEIHLVVPGQRGTEMGRGGVRAVDHLDLEVLGPGVPVEAGTKDVCVLGPGV